MTFRRFGRWLGWLAAVTLLSAAVAGQQQPRYTTRVDVAIIDVGVVDNGGYPIPNLTPEDFSVRIDGRPSRVVMADWVSTTADVARPAPAKVRVPDGYTSNDDESAGRLIAVVLNQPSISANGAPVLQRSASAFVDRLSAGDRVAAIGLGMHRMSTPFTSDHERVKNAIQTMVGERQDSSTLSPPEAIEIEAEELTRPDALMASSGALPPRSRTGTTDSSGAVSRDVSAQFREMVFSSTVGRVMRRECPGVFSDPSGTTALLACRQRLLEEARPVAEQSRRERDATLGRLRELLAALRAIDGPKAVVLVSGGLILDDQRSLIQELGRAAAAAEATLYVLHVERPLASATTSRNVGSAASNPRMERQGLEELATAARGTLLTVNGEGAAAFDRVQSELSGYYLLGVKYDVRNDDGKAHAIRVEVARKGVTIRARQFLLNTAAATAPPAPRSPQALAAAALATPLPVSTVGLRVATFSLRGADASQVQLLIETEIANTASNRPVSLGFTLMDSRGRVVASQLFDTRLGAASPGEQSQSDYVAGATVAPGDYLLKFAVADGDRVGSVEHTVHASLAAAGRITLSDLFAGGPTQSGDPARPTLGRTIRFGRVHGYVEAYGAGVESVSVKYEIAVDEQSPAVLEQSVDAHMDAPGRARFSAIMQAGSLPPREYVLRAVVSSRGQVLKTLTRTFEIAPAPAPADTITSRAVSSPAAGTTTPVVGAELFLPVDGGALRRFSREEAMQPAVLRAFRDRVAPAARPAFDSGVEHLRKGEHTAAEASFKLTIAPGTESTAGLAYLGATYAASGHDAEAAAVWQTALIGGSDLPELFAWAADAFIRAHKIGEAQPIVEEAVSRWPDDQRFAVPQAMLDATLGRGREAVLALARHIAAGHNDPETVFLAAQLMYQAHAQGAVVNSRSEDLNDLRAWAAAYARAGGRQSALMKEWVAFLEREKP